jgi:hypothetical protein
MNSAFSKANKAHFLPRKKRKKAVKFTPTSSEISEATQAYLAAGGKITVQEPPLVAVEDTRIDRQAVNDFLRGDATVPYLSHRRGHLWP